MTRRTNRTTSQAAPFDTLSTSLDTAAPVATPVTAKPAAPKGQAKAKGKVAPAVQAKGKVAPAVQAKAATPAPRVYVYPGDKGRLSAGTLINDMLQRPQGATVPEMVDALVHNLPASYAHNVKAAQAKANAHYKAVAGYTAKVNGVDHGLDVAVTQDPAGRIRCQDAAKWHRLAGGGKCSGGRVVYVDEKGKPLTGTMPAKTSRKAKAA